MDDGRLEATPGERRPERPDLRDLDRRDWKQTLKRTIAEIKEDRVTITAAGLAYYWFLALFPAIIALIGLVSLLGLSTGTVEQLVTTIERALPSGAAQVIADAVRNASSSSGSGIAAIVAIAIAVFSATAGMAALQTGLNVAYDVPEDRKFLAKRAMAVLLMIVMLVLGGIASALLVFGAQIGDWMTANVPVATSVFVWAWNVVRWLLAIGVIMALFSALFFLAPNRDAPRWQWISPGGVVATTMWLAASLGFSFYVTKFGSYGETYGALAGVAILILWLFLTGLAVLVGGELNAELERQADLRKTPSQDGG